VFLSLLKWASMHPVSAESMGGCPSTGVCMVPIPRDGPRGCPWTGFGAVVFFPVRGVYLGLTGCCLQISHNPVPCLLLYKVRTRLVTQAAACGLSS